MLKKILSFAFMVILGFSAVAQDVILKENELNTVNDLKSEFDRIGDDDQQMLNFFRENNLSKYYNSFESACLQRNTGRVLLGAGIGLSIGGVFISVLGSLQHASTTPYNSQEEDKFLTYMAIGYSLMITGEVLIIASIPVSITAGVRKRIIKNEFAKEYFGIKGYTYQPKLNFGQAAHGIGFTLNF
jgi:hypothetical protein